MEYCIEVHRVPCFLLVATKHRHQCSQHRVQYAHYGVGQVHLCAGEGRRDGPGRHNRHERHGQSDPSSHIG